LNNRVAKAFKTLSGFGGRIGDLAGQAFGGGVSDGGIGSTINPGRLGNSNSQVNNSRSVTAGDININFPPGTDRKVVDQGFAAARAAQERQLRQAKIQLSDGVAAT